MAIKLKSGSNQDAQLNETNTAARQYYLPDNDSGLGTRLLTAQASTSGTNIDFNSIPSWVKRITVIFNEVSLSGTAHFAVQIGAGSVTTTGYVATSVSTNNASASSGTNSTSGFVIASGSAANLFSGHLTLTQAGSNIWISAHMGKITTSNIVGGGGSVTLSGTLDRVRITTSNGTDTFDNGSVNLILE